MLVAPKLENFHVLLAHPTFTIARIGKLLRRNWHGGFVSKAGERVKSSTDILRDQFYDEIHVLGKTEESVGIHREASGDQVADSVVLQGGKNCSDGRGFHSPHASREARSPIARKMTRRKASAPLVNTPPGFGQRWRLISWLRLSAGKGSLPRVRMHSASRSVRALAGLRFGFP